MLPNLKEVLESISDGASLSDIARLYGYSVPAVRTWLRKDPERAKLYDDARMDQAHSIVDQLIEIADTADSSVAADVAKAKLRVETRKWLASRLLPRVYGERMMTEITGRDGGPVRLDLKSMDDEALAARIATLIAPVIASQAHSGVVAADSPDSF